MDRLTTCLHLRKNRKHGEMARTAWQTSIALCARTGAASGMPLLVGGVPSAAPSAGAVTG
jgi:hypothetical protein